MKKILIIFIAMFIFIPKVNASTTTAHSYTLMDMTTGRVLSSKDKDNPMLIASITKIMTAIIVIENTDISNIITVDDSILKAYGSGIYIQLGEEMSVKDMLYGLMLRSGNDAAVMLATYISNSEEEFVKLMNNKAKELGMKNTRFNNSSGLDEKGGNYSTSYDMALLTRYAMQNETYREIVKTKNHIVKTNYKTYSWTNKNKLLNYDYITGGKTGYTEKAHRTLVSTASLDNMNLVVVTLNDSDDWNTHTSLYNYAKENYTSYKVLNKSKFKIEGDTYFKGKLVIKDDLYIPLKKEETSSLINHIKLYKIKNYKDNQVVGESQIIYKNNILYSVPIYINKEEPKEKLSLIDKIKKWFND
ncbi:MAG: D-alanyl-D-alanine carboxypeptidase [Bacilli bacterium]|nr:D-alanyl-D-alanine carboxypeptidase [Bacilli bacterium]